MEVQGISHQQLNCWDSTTESTKSPRWRKKVRRKTSLSWCRSRSSTGNGSHTCTNSDSANAESESGDNWTKWNGFKEADAIQNATNIACQSSSFRFNSSSQKLTDFEMDNGNESSCNGISTDCTKTENANCHMIFSTVSKCWQPKVVSEKKMNLSNNFLHPKISSIFLWIVAAFILSLQV